MNRYKTDVNVDVGKPIFGTLEIVQIVLIILKLFNLIDWSWVKVFIPLYIALVVAMLVVIIVVSFVSKNS